MKKFLVITALALFLATLPVLAVTDSDFTANGDVTVTLRLNGLATGAAASLKIKTLSEARSLTVNADGTLDILNASSTSFKVYSDDSTVKAIKIATTTISCTILAIDSGSALAIASSSEAIATSTVTLMALSHALTYNGYCGALTCDQAYQVTGTQDSAICSACAVLTGANTYNSTCGAATCNSGYTLSGSGSSATCVPPSGIISSGGGGGGTSVTACSTVTYDDWQTTCVNSWQYRDVKSSNPSGCTLTTAQDNDRKRSCTSPATPTTPGETPATPASAAQQIKNIVAEAATIAGRSVESVLAAVGAMQDAKAEANALAKYTNPLVSGLKNVTAETKTAITNFVNYGTPTTKILGAGERAGVISSYKAAFGKVPATEAEWSDVIKIGNGRWPSVTSATAEAKAAVEFKKVYKRTPNMQQANDNAAVTVISYGLRPTGRNLNSEKAAIKSFKAIYGHAPVSAIAWDIVRAIAYSGAKR
ncbi:MAG: hypothetical protein PHS62_04365 [Patescibacteria group bacterium]|nr:hypothetical protein [Patescibacteria group bacterium]